MRFPEDVDNHWLEVQRHIHRYAQHGFVIERLGWTICGWAWGGRGNVIALPREGEVQSLDFPLAVIEVGPSIMARTLGDRTRWTIQTASHGADGLGGELVSAGFEVKYTMPVWLRGPDVLDELWKHTKETAVSHPELMPLVDVKGVSNAETLADFAAVQEAACRASFGWSPGEAAMFYANPQSLVGRHTLGLVLYLAGRPVRTVTLYLFEGIASIGGGACVPEFRGMHLGNLLIQLAVEEAFERGAEVVVGFSQPQGIPVGKRYAGEPLLTYQQWRTTGSGALA